MLSPQEDFSGPTVADVGADDYISLRIVHDLFCSPLSLSLFLSLHFQYFSYPWFPDFISDIVPSCNTFRHGYADKPWKRSSTFGRCYKSLFYKGTLFLSTYFLTTQIYKRMRLITQVYSMCVAYSCKCNDKQCSLWVYILSLVFWIHCLLTLSKRS